MRIEETLTGTVPIKRPVSGRYLTLKSADAELCIHGLGIDEVFLGAGESYDMGELYMARTLTIKNTISGANSFVLEVTQNSLRKANQTAMTVNTTAVVENGDDNQHLTKVTVPAGLSAAVAVANSSRKSLRVSLLSGAAGFVLMGKSGVSATSGGSLEPGMVDYIDTRGALWVFNPNAVDVDVYVMEINKL